MKKVFLFALSALLFSFTSNAQITRKANPSQKIQSDSSRDHQSGRMMHRLNLSPDQKVKIKALRQSTRQQRDAILNDKTLTGEQKKIKMRELHKSQYKKMSTILTPDQQAKRNAYLQKMRTERKLNDRKTGNDNKSVSTTGTQ